MIMKNIYSSKGSDEKYGEMGDDGRGSPSSYFKRNADRRWFL